MLKRITLAALALVVATTGPVQARRDLIEVLRSDLRPQKKALITRAMQLDPAQSEKFWPIYADFELELARLNDDRATLMKEYAEHHADMTDARAKNLVKRSFKWQEGRTKLLKKYYSRMEKALSPIEAGRWVQVEHAIDTMIDVQVGAEMPLMR